MPILKKQFKFILFTVAFLIIAPLIVLYANGDIFANGWNLLETGGVYVTHIPMGSEVFLNNKSEGTTSFFSRSILIKGLRPGTYQVSVKKDGYHGWTEKVHVSGNLVFEADVLTLPDPVVIAEITKYMTQTVGTTTVTTKNKNPEYTNISSLFAVATTTISTEASGTLTILKSKLGTATFPVTSGNLSLWQDNGQIFIGWSGDDDGQPQYMCTATVCQPVIEAFDFGMVAKHIDFLPGYNDTILIASGNTVFAIQAENNPQKTRQIIYQGTNPDFIILDGTVYIKDGAYIGKVSL